MRGEKRKISRGAASGTVALIFLILGFQLAVFVMKVVERPSTSEERSAVTEDVASEAKSATDTFVQVRSYKSKSYEKSKLGGYGDVKPAMKVVHKEHRAYESFEFDPNTVSIDSLVRLGLTQKQAESIENYRAKGGKFRRKEDFAKMYVVSDTLYERLEPFIRVSRLELNSADSIALLQLRGIGPFYAHKILEYRKMLGGFYGLDQLLEIYGMDEERLSGFRDDIMVDTLKIKKINLWMLSIDSLAMHPYIGERRARQIERFKSVYDTLQWNVESLKREHILSDEDIGRLRVYLR